MAGIHNLIELTQGLSVMATQAVIAIVGCVIRNKPTSLTEVSQTRYIRDTDHAGLVVHLVVHLVLVDQYQSRYLKQRARVPKGEDLIRFAPSNPSKSSQLECKQPACFFVGSVYYLTSKRLYLYLCLCEYTIHMLAASILVVVIDYFLHILSDQSLDG